MKHLQKEIMNYSQKPVARKDGLVVQEMPDEVLIYDLRTKKGYCLNQTTAFVWKNCDGEKSVSDIAGQFERENNDQKQSELVRLAIDQLDERDLLEMNCPAELPGESRRSALKKIGFASMVALPVIASMASEAKSFDETIGSSAESTDAVQNSVVPQPSSIFTPPNVIVPCSDRTTPLQAGANVMSFMAPAIGYPQFYAYLTTAARSGVFTVDLKRNNISILSTKITIDAGKKTSVASASQAVASVNSLNLGDEIVVDITNAADGSATGLMILLTSGGEPERIAPMVPAGLVLTVKSPTEMTASWAPAAIN